MFTSKYKTYLITIFCVVYSVIIVRSITVSVYDSGRARNQIYGDGYSDINAISAAHYFLDSGFTKSALLPVHNYYPKEEGKTPGAYTHYPALPDVLAGVYATLFQTASEPWLRIIPVLLSILFFLFIYKVLFEVLKNPHQAFVGGTAMVISNYFICWADNLHQHLYGEALKWLYFLLLYRHHESGARKVTFIPLLFIMMIQVNISFEQPVYLGILTLGFSIWYKRNPLTFETITGAGAVLFGFGLHVFQNAIYFNSMHLAIEDLKHAFLFRTTGTALAGQQAEASFTMSEIWSIPFNWVNRIERFFILPGWFMIALFLITYRKVKIAHPKVITLFLVLFFASISWALVMPQHGFIHSFTAKHFSILYAFMAAILLPLIPECLTTMKAKGTAYYVGFILLLGYGGVMFITQQLWPVYLQFGWLNVFN
jgi:hypothetical protein